ncbi:MAG TPA: hypothetical protein VD811_10650 [Desulfuromonadales bacterium]|nr:hypothetical protein [Desulfuromonadales bacterium]
MNAKKILRVHLIILLLALLVGGCATPRQPLVLAPDFRDAGIRVIHLPAVSFERRYEPPYNIDLDSELRQRLAAVLKTKGYQVDLTPDGEKTDATLQVHVDFLFISETLSDRQPPPVIDIEAAARMVSAKDGRELWRDRGGGRVGGTGGTRIFYPTADRYLALSLLADHLLATLPSAVAR